MSEDGITVTRDHLEAMVSACDGHPPLTDLSELFVDVEGRSSTSRSVEDFESWILHHPDLASFTEWLLREESSDQGLQLEAEPDPPTFYQNLSARYDSKFVDDGRA